MKPNNPPCLFPKQNQIKRIIYLVKCVTINPRGLRLLRSNLVNTLEILKRCLLLTNSKQNNYYLLLVSIHFSFYSTIESI